MILTTFDLDEYVFDALSAGATGFLLKHARPEELLFGIRAAADGHALVAPALTRRLIERFARGRPRAAPELGELTEREREVLIQLIRGQSNAEIARNLFVSESTVKTHVARVFTKLRLRDRAQAVIYGYETGLVTPGSQSNGVTAPSARRPRPEGLRPAAGQRTLNAAERRAVLPPVQQDPEVRSLSAGGALLRGDPEVAAPVRGAVRQIGRGDVLAAAGALEQAVTLARIGMLTVHEQPGNRTRAGRGADGHRDHRKRAQRHVGKREYGTTGIGWQSQSRSGYGGRDLMAGIPQRRTKAGDRVIPVRYEQPEGRDHAQAGQQDHADRDPAAAASRCPPVTAPRSRLERHDICLPVHAHHPLLSLAYRRKPGEEHRNHLAK